LRTKATGSQRDAVAALVTDAIDPMFVIRWKDIFAVLEEAIDSTEKAAAKSWRGL